MYLTCLLLLLGGKLNAILRRERERDERIADGSARAAATTGLKHASCLVARACRACAVFLAPRLLLAARASPLCFEAQYQRSRQKKARRVFESARRNAHHLVAYAERRRRAENRNRRRRRKEEGEEETTGERNADDQNAIDKKKAEEEETPVRGAKRRDAKRKTARRKKRERRPPRRGGYRSRHRQRLRIAHSPRRPISRFRNPGSKRNKVIEPPPPPPPRRSFWSRLFGSGGEPTGNYRYLSRSVIDAIRRAPVQRARWKFIIVHNSGTRQGNARAFDYYHRHVRRMQNGLAYHFVVGNGTSSGNGQIEMGDRWRRQINGGHVHSDYLNNISLGICLVGDFNRDQPTRAQLAGHGRIDPLSARALRPVEGGNIPVRPHREMNPPRWATDCPGDAFPYSWFRRF